ncbi:MAG: hypothetical protein R3E98_12125 [Gemmatimonadota bacterium]
MPPPYRTLGGRPAAEGGWSIIPGADEPRKEAIPEAMTDPFQGG